MNNRKGFTILELIIVVAIITILATFLIPAGGKARERARQAKARSHIAALEVAITAFQTDFGFYPTSQFSGSSPNFTVNSGATVESNNATIIQLLTGFSFSGGNRSASSNALVTSSVWNGPYLDLDVSDVNGSGAMIDPWTNPYAFSLDLDGNPGTTPPSHNLYTFDISSAGPDESSGTSDDVINY
ncbi:MAG: prepilin-type N-terminal cleavage/methylation domain-containing protein [Candidatus Omnitrophica bacterium]|nr:prepilin-type N-terminal cleavage/methylation domain-containing protein [Candidatus Omnitrophota bacterium]